MDNIETGKKNFEDVLREVYSEVKEIIKSSMQKRSQISFTLG